MAAFADAFSRWPEAKYNIELVHAGINDNKFATTVAGKLTANNDARAEPSQRPFENPHSPEAQRSRHTQTNRYLEAPAIILLMFSVVLTSYYVL